MAGITSDIAGVFSVADDGRIVESSSIRDDRDESMAAYQNHRRLLAFRSLD